MFTAFGKGENENGREGNGEIKEQLKFLFSVFSFIFLYFLIQTKQGKFPKGPILLFLGILKSCFLTEV